MDFHLGFDESGFGIFLFALLPGNRLCSLSFSQSGSSLNQALHKTHIMQNVMFSCWVFFDCKELNAGHFQHISKPNEFSYTLVCRVQKAFERTWLALAVN